MRRNATRWRIPPDSSPRPRALEPLEPERGEVLVRRAARRALATRPRRRSASAGVVERAQPRQQRVALRHQRGRARRSTVPASGAASPHTSSSSVDLPHPLGPTTATDLARRGAQRHAVERHDVAERLARRRAHRRLPSRGSVGSLDSTASLPPRALPHRFEGSAQRGPLSRASSPTPLIVAATTLASHSAGGPPRARRRVRRRALSQPAPPPATPCLHVCAAPTPEPGSVSARRGLGSARACSRICPTTAPARRGGSCSTSCTTTGVRLGGAQAGGRRSSRLALLPVERLLGGEQRYTRARDRRARRAATSRRCWPRGRALGLPVPDAGRRRRSARRTSRPPRSRRRSAEAGFETRGPAGDQPRARARDRALRRGAARPRSPRRVLEPDTGRARARAPLREPRPRARAAQRAVDGVRLPAAPAPDAAQRGGHAAGAARSGRGDDAQRRGRVRRPRRLHRAGQTVDVDELSDVPGGSQRMAGELVEPPVRLVKVDRRRGDARRAASRASWSTPRSRLVERAEETDGFPPLRAGVAYGPAANHFGDWFGSTVNLASRLTARARAELRARHREVREGAATATATRRPPRAPSGSRASPSR